MTYKKKTLLVGGIALLVVGGALAIGSLLDNYFGGENMNHSNSRNQQAINGGDSLVQEDSSDYKTYTSLRGDAYDKRFIADMIIHHESAVDMAGLALERAEREDIKAMSLEIISAQTDEINNMKQWQQQWGYASGESADHSEHSTMSMSDHMEMMMKPLREKTGEAFDKEWIAQMIAHHQGAINMSASAEQNAKHQEVKDLARDIIADQAKEIKQMKQWQTQ